MTAYYNEIDPYAAQWLRNLIAAGHIAPGVVDERDIRDVLPSELTGYTQCHFFAGIGGWSYALRLAGWTDDRPVWTGSCPCQPFSAAGRGDGFADERHLWPAWHWIILECRPSIVFGEQVASKDGLKWLDLVQADMEGASYAVGAADLCAAGVEAPHIRQRLGFVAHADRGGQSGLRRRWQARVDERGAQGGVLAHANFGTSGQGGAQPRGGDHGGDAEQGPRLGSRRSFGAVAHDERARLEEQRQQQAWRECAPAERSGAPSWMAYTDGRHACAEREQRSGQHGQQPSHGGALGGPWRDAEWLPCIDNTWRPAKPGAFPLAHGVPGRVGKLRAYGNAIVPQVFAEFIAASREALGEDGVVTLRQMIG